MRHFQLSACAEVCHMQSCGILPSAGMGIRVQVSHDEHTMVVQDKFPKGRVHLLVIARDKCLLDISCLRRQHVPVLDHMVAIAERSVLTHGQGLGIVRFHPSSCLVLWRSSRYCIRITQHAVQLLHTQTWYSNVWHLLQKDMLVGFHWEPSLKQMHMHVVSRELQGTGMKRAQHWRSFTSPFFRKVQDVHQELTTTGCVAIDFLEIRRLNGEPLVCPECGQKQASVKVAQSHLENCLRMSGHAAAR